MRNRRGERPIAKAGNRVVQLRRGCEKILEDSETGMNPDDRNQAVFFSLHSMQTDVHGTAFSRAMLISSSQLVQMPYVPFSIRSIAASIARSSLASI